MYRSQAPSQRGRVQQESKPQISNRKDHHSFPIQDESEWKGRRIPELRNSRKFNVIYGRITNRKVKVFEHDGILEVAEKYMILRDLNNQVQSSMQSNQFTSIENGQEIIVGSKEVQIVNEIKEVVQQECVEENVHVIKRIKMEPLPEINKEKVLSNTKQEILDKEDGFYLRDPPAEHQWYQNIEGKSLTKVRVHSQLAKKLRPHQKDGVKFLYECIMGFRNTIHDTEDIFGAILADEMGLGKTLQCIALCHTLLRSGPYGGDPVLRKILIVTPSSLVSNWEKEIDKWMTGIERLFCYIVDEKHKARNYSPTKNMPFMIISYEMLMKNFDEISGFDLLICDEGHRLKNFQIKTYVLFKQINCKRRIILTGTPIQNDLREFYSLIDFVQPNLFPSYNEYRQKYEMPIVKGQGPDASPQSRELSEKLIQELKNKTGTFILRRLQEVNKKFLKEKQEIIIFCRPSNLQIFLLERAIEMYTNNDFTDVKNPLTFITLMKKICNHPGLITTNPKDEFAKELTAFVNSQKLGPSDSGKLVVLKQLLLSVIKEKKERVVVVSFSTKALDLIENMCNDLSMTTCRLDGGIASLDRTKIVERFNRTDSNTNVFLLSGKAGGVGLNLIGASRLILFDNDWNPSMDDQATSRIWRDGQTKNCYIYRLVTSGSIEEKIFQRQISKTVLGSCVVDNSRTESNNFSSEDLKNLFSITENYDECLTHKLMKCNCSGNGSISNPAEEEESSEDEELSLMHRVIRKEMKLEERKSRNFLKLDRLFQYEHYSPPIEQPLLSELGLRESLMQIVYLFRTTSVKDN